MDNKKEEIGRLHNELLYTTIAIDYLNPRINHGEDFARFRSNCRNYLSSSVVQSHVCCEDLLDELEKKGYIKAGEYDSLKDIVSFSKPMVSEIEYVERSIRSIKQRGAPRRSRKRKASESIDESTPIDDILVRIDFCEVIPLENEKYEAVLKKLNKVSWKIFDLGSEIFSNHRDLYKEFSEFQKQFNDRKEESARMLRLFYSIESPKVAKNAGKKIIECAKDGIKLIRDNPSDYKIFLENWTLYNQRLKEHIGVNTWLSRKGAKVRKKLFASLFLFLMFDCIENLKKFMTEYSSGILKEELQEILITEDFLRSFKLKSAKVDIFIDQEEFDLFLSDADRDIDRDNDDSEQVSQLTKKIEAAEQNVKEGRRKESFRQAREVLEGIKGETILPKHDDIARLMDIFRKVQRESFMIKTYYQGKLKQEASVAHWDGFTLWEELYRKRQDHPEMILEAVQEIIEEILNAENIKEIGSHVQTMVFQDILYVHGLIQERHTQYYIENDILSAKMKIVVMFGNHLLKKGQFDDLRRLCVAESRQSKGNVDMIFLWAEALFFLGEYEDAHRKISEAKEKHQDAESVTLSEIDELVRNIESKLEESYEENVPDMHSDKSAVEYTTSDAVVRTTGDDAESLISEEEENNEFEEQEILERKSSSSQNSESGVSSHTDFTSSSSSDIHVMQNRIPLVLDEDEAYTGKDSSSEADSGVGRSVPSVTSSDVDYTHRYGRQHGRIKDEDIVDFDEYLNGIQLSKHAVDELQKSKTDFHFPYQKLERNNSKLLEMCNNVKYKRCVVEVKGAHEAVCIEMNNPTAKHINISGRSRCGRVFTGDEVVVHILEGGDIIPRLQREVESEIFGEIVGFFKRNRHPNIKHPVFLCVFDHTDDQVASVRPICKTVPKILIRQKKETRRNEIELYRHNQIHKTLSFVGTKLINPKVRHNMVLLVAYIQWEKGMYPQGVVLHLFERGVSLKQELDLLSFQNGIKQSFSLDLRQPLIEIPSLEAIQEAKGRDDFGEIFAITRSDNDIPCHAFSLKAMDSGMKYLGIHIVDVSQIITENTPLDIEAGKRGCSFQSESYQHSMIPEEIVEKFCKLNDEFAVPTISVIFEVEANGEIKEDMTLRHRSLQKLSYTLSFDEAQNVIDQGVRCQRCEDKRECHLVSMLCIAKRLRRGRLGDAEFAYCLEMEIDEDNIIVDIEKHHDVRIITEEFLHLINYYTARTLQSKGKIFPVIHQPPPDRIFVRNWKKSFEPLWNFVVSLQDNIVGNGDKVSLQKEKLDNIRYTKIIGIQISFWEQIVKCIERHSNEELKKLMFTDELHPILAVAKQQWLNFQSNETVNTASPKSRKSETVHYKLHFPLYCSITRPLQCYSDIITQRILSSASYSVDQMDNITSNANEHMSRLRQFNQEAKKIQISSQISRKHLSVTAFVYALDKIKIEIIIPGYESVGEGNIFQINVCDLQASGEVTIGQDVISGNDYLTIKWEKRLYSLEKKTGSVATNSDVHNINPHQQSHFLLLSKWRSLVQMIMRGESDFRGRIGNIASVREYAPESRRAVMDVSSELFSGLIVNQLCTFSLRFVLGQIINLQIQSDFVNGKLEILPQFLEITSNFKLCLNHIRDPVSCFETHAGSKVKTVYTSLKDYSETWIPILLMEAATTALTNDSITVNHVTVNFEGKGGFFYLDKGFCEMRDIELASISLEFFQCHDPNDVYVTPRADYLCMRCSSQEFHTSQNITTMSDKECLVLHAKICDIRNEVDKKRYRIDFHCHFRNQVLGENERRTGRAVRDCGIEILPKGEVMRRIEIILKRLDLAGTLPKVISIRKHQKIPQLDEDHRIMARDIGDDIIEDGVTLSNANQRKAIHKALHSSFSLIQGPPGTGKTFTAVKLVYLFCKINRCLDSIKNEKSILVFCGPSNKSVDVVAKATLETLRDVEHAPKICRLYGKLIENSVYPIPGRSARSKRYVERHADVALKDISVHNLIRKDGNPYAEKLKEFDEFFKSKSIEDLQTDKDLYYKYLKNIKEYRKHVTEATLEQIQNFEAIFCTTSVATKGLLFQRKRVFQIIIDEAGMCTEPETIAAIVATGAKQVVLIGDHKQLRPIVNNLDAKKKGLDQSLFEQYARLTEDESMQGTINFTRLTTQYRMHQKICAFPSRQFYEDELETDQKSVSGPPPKIAEIWPVNSSPIVFCHVEGTEEKLTHSMEEGNQMSRKNIQEVEQVVRVYKRLIKLRVDPSQIIVMSQYNAQCSLMKKKLADENFTDAHVSTVFQSQGGEWDYVIFSTVCSLPEYRIEPQPTLGWQKANLGFITDEHQINVALTRAKRGLVIIGNKNLLIRDNKVWKELIKHYEKEKCVVDAPLFPKAKPKKRRASTRVDKNEGDWTDA